MTIFRGPTGDDGGVDEASVLAALAASAAAKDMGGGNIENTGLDDGGVLFVDGAGNIVSDLFTFRYNNTTKRLSLAAGASPVSVIDLRAANPGSVGGAQAGLITMHSTAVGTAAISGISGHSSGANQLWYLGSFNASSHIMYLVNRENEGFIFGTNDTFRLIIQADGDVQIVEALGVGIANPVASARLQVESTTRGFLPPRMTTVQRDAIGSPATGLVVFNTTNGSLDFFDGAIWQSIMAPVVDDAAEGGTPWTQTYVIPSGADANVDFVIDDKIEITEWLAVLSGSGTAGSTLQCQTTAAAAITDAVDVSGGTSGDYFRPSNLTRANAVIAAAGSVRFRRVSTGGDFPGAFVTLHGVRRT